MTHHFKLFMTILCFIAVLLTCASVVYGPTFIPLAEIITALSHHMLGLGLVDNNSGTIDRIIIDLRLPRAFLAIVVGAGLGIIGLLLQTVTRNNLADPFLLGLSAGAATGAVLVITRIGDHIGLFTLPIAAFVGGICATFTVLLLMYRTRGYGPERLILSGLAVSFLFTAFTNYLIFSGDYRAAHTVLFWTMGGLGLANWNNILVGIGGLLLALCYILAKHRHLDALLAGESTAESLGIRIVSLRISAFLAASFSTALLVSIVGVISFIGLMVPHIARSFAGSLHKYMTIACCLLGATLLLASDLLARILFSPQELPVSVVTSAIGAFFVIVILLKKSI